MRIIGGQLRGRDLGSVPDGVRPTSDRVRESLFAALGDLEGARVLDLFAGTGALGLEAYSRGAECVVFVERSRKIARTLRRRLERIDLADEEGLRVIEGEAITALGRLAGEPPFDLVLVDPPYVELEAQGAGIRALEALFAGEILGLRGTVVVEGPKRHPVPPLPGVRVVDERRYGDTLLTWLERASPVGR